MRYSKATLAVALLGALWVASASAQDPTAGLPVRNMSVGGAQFSTQAYVDMGTFQNRIFPLDDRALIDSPQIAVLCFAPGVPPTTWSLFVHMPLVNVPIAWYYPLSYDLGVWKYEYGDTLFCQMWDCDGNPNGGCDPAKQAILPNATAQDDLLGQATLSFGAFQVVGSALLNLTVPDGSTRAQPGAPAGLLLLDCPGCHQLWQQNPNWVNTYQSQGTGTSTGLQPSGTPTTSPPGAIVASPSPDPGPFTSLLSSLTSLLPPMVESFQGAAPSPESTAAPAPVAVPLSPPAPVALPSPSPSPSPILSSPSPSPRPQTIALPPSELQQPTPEVPQQQENTSLPAPPPAQTAKKATNSTLIIILSVLGAFLAILVITGLCCACRWCCGWRAVKPPKVDADPPKPALKPGATRHLRIRVQRPADADAALRQHRVDGALAELPWEPKV